MGYPFTWCNNREKENRISKRLDRFLANSLWCELFTLGSVSHYQTAYSDHYPIGLNKEEIQVLRKGPKSFKFKAICTKEEECSIIIDDVWSSRITDGSIGAIMQLIK